MLQDVYQNLSSRSFIRLSRIHCIIPCIKLSGHLCKRDFDVATEPDRTVQSFGISPYTVRHTYLHIISLVQAPYTLIKVRKILSPLSELYPNNTLPASGSNETPSIRFLRHLPTASTSTSNLPSPLWWA